MDYVAEFERHLFEDGKSPSTILSYVGDIKGFLAHLE
ncbi:MAG TPA: integrase, partial [Tissierellia bacterium]|nr:integrase [Tissierellia bacterium]